MSRLVLLAVVPLVFAGVGVAEAIRDRAPERIKLTLEQVKEIRRTDYVKDPSGAGFGMFDAPGLHLRFGIEAPSARKIVEIRQPSTLAARDSAGTDLAKLPPSPFGEPKHVDTIREWEKPPHAVTFKLALPRRSAKSFTLTAQMEALTYLDTEVGTLQVGAEWKDVPDGLLGADPFKVRVQRQRGSVHLVLEPGTARDILEKVELQHTGAPLESEGTMWNDRQVAYMFTAAPDPGAAETLMTARLTVRKGVSLVPITIELADEPLP